jgi:hypothetical protein
VTAISLSDSCSVHLVGATERAHSCIMRTMIIAAVLVLATPAVADDRISDREWAEVCSQITDRERAEACRRIKARFDRGEHFNPNWGKECGKHCLPADFDASFAPPLLFPRALLHVPHDTGFNENNGRRAPRVRWGWTRWRRGKVPGHLANVASPSQPGRPRPSRSVKALPSDDPVARLRIVLSYRSVGVR